MRKIANKQLFAEMKRTQFGATYRGIDLDSQQLVLVKTFRRHGNVDEAAEARFEREAQIYAKISHPNVVRLLEYGIEDELKYLVLEYIEGLTLRQLLKANTSTLPLQIALVLFRDILQGLAALHHNQIVHHDLKPENILISREGMVKICDFDLAIAGEKSHSSGLTGTHGYLAPEVILGEKVNSAADMFSAGIVLYEMLTGTRPFEANSSGGTMMATVQMPHLPPSKVRADIHPFFDELSAALLEKKSELRPGSNDVLSGLQRRIVPALLQKNADVICAYLAAPQKFVQDHFDQFVQQQQSDKVAAHRTRRRLRVALAAVAMVVVSAFWITSGWQIKPEQTIQASGNTKQLAPAIAKPLSPDSIAAFVGENKPLDSPTPATQTHTEPSTNTPNSEAIQAVDEKRSAAPIREPASVVLKRNVVIQSQPWAFIFVDGDSIGPTPMRQPLVLEQGFHELLLKKPLFPNLAFSIDVNAGMPDTLHYSLWEHVTTLELQVTPWAEVAINGLPQALQDGESELILSPGKYEISFEHPMLGQRNETLFLQPGERRVVSVNMFTQTN